MIKTMFKLATFAALSAALSGSGALAAPQDNVETAALLRTARKLADGVVFD